MRKSHPRGIDVLPLLQGIGSGPAHDAVANPLEHFKGTNEANEHLCPAEKNGTFLAGAHFPVDANVSYSEVRSQYSQGVASGLLTLRSVGLAR